MSKAAGSCRAKILRPPMSLAHKLEERLADTFENTGWHLVPDKLAGNVAVHHEECSVEFQLQSDIKV